MARIGHKNWYFPEKYFSCNLNNKVYHQIWLSENLSVDNAIGVLGHEAFLHIIEGQNRLRVIRNKLNEGALKPGTKEYGEALEILKYKLSGKMYNPWIIDWNPRLIDTSSVRTFKTY